MRKALQFLVISVGVLAISGTALAQTTPGQSPTLNPSALSLPSSFFSQYAPNTTGTAGITDPLVLAATPSSPGPNTLVTVSVSTTFFDLSGATIGWLENGSLMESGVGKTEHAVLTGPVGSAITVTAVVTDPSNQEVYQKSITIRPAAVDLIWEAPTTVPPFYRGKALYQHLGSVSVTAIPNVVNENGDPVSASKLVYTWRLNGDVLGNLSGYGKSELLLTQTIYRTPFVVSVLAQTPDGSVAAEASVSIDTAPPAILLYENNPLYGVLFNHTVGNTYALQGQEATLEAYPYFFSAPDRNQLSYRWVINGQTQNVSGPSVTLRNTSGQSGTASVYLEATNPGRLLEAGTKSITVTLGQSTQ